MALVRPPATQEQPGIRGCPHAVGAGLARPVYQGGEHAALAGRPDLMGGRTSLTVYPGMIGMKEDAFINVKNRSHSITAEVEIPKTGVRAILAPLRR
jgi:hypothetical protein